MLLSLIKRFLVGEPLSNQMASHGLIPKWKALAVLSSDALSSVAYATEEILIPLSALGSAAMIWSIPIALAIALLLLILTFSYRQTIDRYPNGGGAYIVAKENLGTSAGLVAAASLLVDYVLTVAVSTASGVENLTSAIPGLAPYQVALGAAVIILITLVNLRGVKESSTIFAIPTYFFIFSFLLMILVGFFQVLTQTQVPAPSLLSPLQSELYPQVSILLLLRAFASGCSALTGIEAISNGIPMFKRPGQRNAKITLSWMSTILAVLFLGITFLTHYYRLTPHSGETIVSSLAHTIFGDTISYYLLQISTALILFLAANTSYADFPRLSSLLAWDRYVPKQLASLGDRLVYSNGILGLGVAAILLLILFQGKTHLLIPLYAIGVFLSFSLSQFGMVRHHLKHREPNWKRSLFFNGVGAMTTSCILVVIAATKFLLGAWMVILFIPLLVMVFLHIHQHYMMVKQQLSLTGKHPSGELKKLKHTVVVPVSGMHEGVLEALRYALSISDEIRACYVETDPKRTEHMTTEWQKWAHQVPLVILRSPFRSIIWPVLEYLDDIQQMHHEELITVIIPEFVTPKWRHRLLHNQTAFFIQAALLFRPRKVVINVRYYLKPQ